MGDSRARARASPNPILALTSTLHPNPNPNQVGRWLDAQTAAAMAKEEEYDLADDKRQKAMLDEVRKEPCPYP